MFKCNSIFINSITKLKLFKYIVLNSSVVALDTEFIRKSTYKANLSILQVCTNAESVFIIDYLEHPNIVLDALRIIYSSNAIKVFHAAKNDLEIFYKLMGKLPSNIFDTQIAFLALSPLTNISYAYLIKETLNIQLDKTETLSDWSKRPFTDKQLIYASQDVSMLFKAYFILYQKLQELNRLEFIKERLLILTDINNYIFNLDKVVEKYIVKYNITKNYSLLAAIIDYRENIAQNINIPKKYILKEDIINHIINNPKLGNNFFKNNKYINQKIWEEIKQRSRSIFSYFNNIKIKKSLPKHQLLDLSLKFLEYISLKENVNKELICAKIELNKFLNDFDYNNNSLKKDNALFFIEWRYKIFTKKLLDFLTGKISLTINNGTICFK